MQGGSLYIHVPFCAHKCGYCDFYSFVGDEESISTYTELLLQMIRTLPGGPHSLSTLYFGGGSPSILGADRIAKILEAVSKSCVLNGTEITLECNPEGVNQPFFEAVRRAGVNRISMGMQSAVANELLFLGRRHTHETLCHAVEAARAAGVKNLSLDMMLGIPGQTLESLETSLAALDALAPQHVSAYLLKLEPGTPLFESSIKDLCPDEEIAAECYLYTASRLSEMGYRQYEISNFARSGCRSRHNLAYWTLSPYIGLGPAAHTFFKGRRLSFPADLSALLSVSDPYTLWQDDGPGGDREERIMLGLRLSDGLPLEQLVDRDPPMAKVLLSDRMFLEQTPENQLLELSEKNFLGDGLFDTFQKLLQGRLALLEEGRLSLTPKGFLLSNDIIASILRHLDL